MVELLRQVSGVQCIMMVKMRSIGTFVYHEKLAYPGDILLGTTSEYEYYRGADCVLKICDVEDEIQTQMIDTEKRTERRIRKR